MGDKRNKLCRLLLHSLHSLHSPRSLHSRSHSRSYGSSSSSSSSSSSATCWRIRRKATRYGRRMVPTNALFQLNALVLHHFPAPAPWLVTCFEPVPEWAAVMWVMH